MTEAEVERFYSGIVREGAAPFVKGRELAEDLGYPGELLDGLPPACVEAFCGVSCVPGLAVIEQDQVVLDLGCGAGLDALMASSRASQVVAVDFSLPMLELARQTLSGVRNVVLLQASAHELPLLTGSIDVALVNGLFNLNPARSEVFAELARVVRPGGAVYAAEIVLSGPLPESLKDPANWFA